MGLQKPCTWGTEDGSNRMSRGETVEIYSMVTLSIEDLHVSGAVPKSIAVEKLEGVPRAGKDDEKGAGAAAEGMEDEVCVLGLGVLAKTQYTSLP